MRISQQLTILTICAVLVIILVAASAFFCVWQLTESHASVAKNAENLELTQELCFHVAYSSAAQRAYIITGFDSSLDNYRAEINGTKQTFDKLQASIADNPAQKDIAEKLGRALNDRLASLETTRQIYETKGRDAAFARIRQGVGLAMMARVIELANSLRDFELHQLIDAHNRAETDAKNTQLTIILGSLVAIAIIVITNMFFSRNLSNAVTTLLRASQNVAHERFESIVDIGSTNELGDLGRAFNTLAGHLKDKAQEADESGRRMIKAEEDLKAKLQELHEARKQLGELSAIIQDSQLEQDLSGNHYKNVCDHVKDVLSLSDMLGSSLHQILDFSRDVRVAAETLDRKCMDLSEGVVDLSDQAHQVSKALDAIWQNLPETKDLVGQLDNVEDELSVLNMVSSMSAAEAKQLNEKVIERLKEIRNELTGTKSKLNIQVTHLQQMTRQALDASSNFESSLKGASKPLQAINNEMADLLKPTMAGRAELINLERLHQRQISAMEQIGNYLSLVESSRVRQSDLVARMNLKAKSFAESNGNLSPVGLKDDAAAESELASNA